MVITIDIFVGGGYSIELLALLEQVNTNKSNLLIRKKYTNILRESIHFNDTYDVRVNFLGQ